MPTPQLQTKREVQYVAVRDQQPLIDLDKDMQCSNMDTHSNCSGPNYEKMEEEMAAMKDLLEIYHQEGCRNHKVHC